MDLLYLHYQHSAIAGPERIAGKHLYSSMRTSAKRAATAHMIVKDEDFHGAASSFQEDVVSETEVLSEGFNTIYCEGGPRSSFSDNGAWLPKIDYQLAERFVRQGGIVVYSDVDFNFARKPDDRFCDLTSAWFSESSGYPIYFMDKANASSPSLMEVELSAVKPRVANWLQSAFEQTKTLVVSNAVQLHSVQFPLLFSTQRTVGTLCQDLWWSAPYEGVDHLKLCYHPNGPQRPDLLGPFACVKQLGHGFIVTIAAIVSPDRLAKDENDASLFFCSLIESLKKEVELQKETAGFQRFRGIQLFLSHRSTDKPVVQNVANSLRQYGVRIWFDKDKLIPSDSVGLSINGGLQESTHFVLFWSANCVNAPWVEFELGAAITACVEAKKPILIVTLDETPVPASIAQYLRVNGKQATEGVGAALREAVERLADRKNR
jgi:hypothetical protein